MNKEVIYIEPEDDITDIIAKIEDSKEKIVALVPPKKAGVFRSVVNIKLIAKAGKTSEKSVVLVTIDPSITKLAAASKLPVAKNLQTAPVIPVVESGVEESSSEQVDEDGKTQTDDKGEEEAEEAPKEEKVEGVNKEEEKDEDSDEDEDEEEEEKKEAEKPKKKERAKTKGGLIGWIKEHKKLSAVIGIGILCLIIFLIWALFIAPAVDVFVSIKTDTNNFSEVVSFVKDQSQENIEEGKIYLEERKIESVQEVQFEATGTKNRGEKATGDLVIYSYFSAEGMNPVNVGTVFKISGLSYIASENVTLSWDGSLSSCENKDNSNDPVIDHGKIKCLISGRVSVSAAEAGEKYNIAKSSTGWDTVANVAVYSDKAMGGGTDDVITVVQQSDIEKVRGQLEEANGADDKEKLYSSIPEDSLVLESTFSQTTSSATSTPAVDEEVKEGVKPILKTVTTTSVYTIDKTKLEELIRSKVSIVDNKKIFEIRNMYIDGFRELEGGFTGKLKAVYFTGPRITESEVVEKIKGKGLGDARREISDIEGVSEVKMSPSYSWVFSVPTDSNRITTTFEIKDQNGQMIEEKVDDGKKSEEESAE